MTFPTAKGDTEPRDDNDLEQQIEALEDRIMQLEHEAKDLESDRDHHITVSQVTHLRVQGTSCLTVMDLVVVIVVSSSSTG